MLILIFGYVQSEVFANIMSLVLFGLRASALLLVHSIAAFRFVCVFAISPDSVVLCRHVILIEHPQNSWQSR